MRESERGFTLVEMVIAVAITAILLLAGGVWMMSLRPGALRGAVNDFDSALAAARQLAATSGNGATLAFVPRTDGAQGFMLRVYSGRPNATNAVTAANMMAVSSNAAIREATYGSPPFAIFLSSAGYPTGKASYPSVDNSGTITFPIVAKQPQCPASGITLTFTSPQGATQTRSLKCNTAVSGVAAANPSPTPNPPHIVPQSMVAHWTGDANPLQFKVAEIGYSHWFASSTGVDCQTVGSDNGNAPASFPSGWPYSSPLTPSETSLSPSAPSFPYSWPNGNVDDPAALFHMQPSVGGTCTVRIVDDYNQEVDAHVQVMGNLTSDTSSLTFASPTAAAQTITFSKTWNNETLQLQAGGACGGIITASRGAFTTPAQPGTTPAKALLTIAPVSSGSCTLIVGDQYGEPTISIPINVKAPLMKTWPIAVMYGASGANLAASAAHYRPTLASMINAALGGGVANAANPCPAIAYKDSAMTQVDANDSTFASIGVTTDAHGCYSGQTVAYEPGGGSASYTLTQNTCGSSLKSLQWTAQPAVSSALSFAAGPMPVGSCGLVLQDNYGSGQGTSGNGLVIATVSPPLCGGKYCIIEEIGMSDFYQSDAGTASSSAMLYLLDDHTTTVAVCQTSTACFTGSGNQSMAPNPNDPNSWIGYTSGGFTSINSYWAAQCTTSQQTIPTDAPHGYWGGEQPPAPWVPAQWLSGATSSANSDISSMESAEDTSAQTDAQTGANGQGSFPPSSTGNEWNIVCH